MSELPPSNPAKIETPLSLPASQEPALQVTQPKLLLKKLRFNDGTIMELEENDIVVFVGPNNAGKSQALRDIQGEVRSAKFPSVVIKGVDIRQAGTEADVERYIESLGKRDSGSTEYIAHVGGHEVRSSWIQSFWTNAPANRLSQLTDLFVQHLDVQSRLSAANTAPSFARATGYPTKPAHYVYGQPKLEDKIATAFKQAFGTGMVYNRAGGSEIPILFGDRPAKELSEDEYSESYQKKLSNFPLISSQGDGMRCFAGILLNVIATPTSVLLIDEPEAFLHPPQARVLGRFLAASQKEGTQLLLATHSSDLLRGLLDANTGRIRVIRITREGTTNQIKQLKNDDIATFWKDPLLRFSNALDGLFHDKVVVTEADGDCRFYSAVADATANQKNDVREPDILFTPTFGKERLLVIVKALRAIGVPTIAVSDIDCLLRLA